MEEAVDAILQVAREDGSLTELSDVEIDGDGSSSLSEIEDKDGDQDEDAEGSDELSIMSDDENDSEAETERLEESPRKFRQQQDLVMSANGSNQIYEHSPSKLHQQTGPADLDDDDDEPLSSDGLSQIDPDSPKSSEHGDPEQEPTTAATSLGDSAGEGKNLLSVADADTRKRKRSIMAGGAVDEDPDEPLRKRTGSVMIPGDDYAIEDDVDPDEEGDLSHPISGNVSGDEEEVAQEDEILEEVEEAVAAEENNIEAQDIPISPKKRGRKKKKAVENGVEHEDPDGDIAVNGDYEVRNGDEGPDVEGDDEAEAAMKNEEELEKKRIALDQLATIERQFATFRDRLYEERLAQLNREEEMLRQDNPTHPGYLSMMRAITARRDERIRIADKLREFELENLKIQSVAKRSQILVQYQQEVREIREKKLENLGQKWYEIQHDRRNHAGSVPDYALKFPVRKSQQILNQIAYNSEVSILSGIAKHVGFPAAPPMASATAAELEDDFEKMGRSRQIQQPQPAMPLQELAALRHASSSSRIRPAEEQFMKETPWANPQHPSHAHMLQRQTSAQQIPRTSSPFSQPRRNSHQPGSGLPISGTFSNSSSLLHHSNGVHGGRISPHNPFANSNHNHTIAPSPLGSRQPSLSPQQNRHPPALPEQQNGQNQGSEPPKGSVNQQASVGLSETPRDFPPEVRREATSALANRY
ncbi:hypothetical protein VTL71DRAFT_13711 [Oculimacula yallundae]|uniref:Transcriptional regulatory protein DEP1 n=1 Tax=Oculimacula yallundae TaxID=86028 RepID=A0ABR4CL57_9HELO